jgi:hypothetical protein
MQTREELLQLAFQCLGQAARLLDAASEDLLVIRRRGRRVVGTRDGDPGGLPALHGDRRLVGRSRQSRAGRSGEIESVRHSPMDSPWRSVRSSVPNDDNA